MVDVIIILGIACADKNFLRESNELMTVQKLYFSIEYGLRPSKEEKEKKMM